MASSAVPPKIIIICGPTASGKSALAMEFAQRFDGEIINGDSVQVYRGFDIGSAKPDAQEQRQVPHHLLDVADFSDAFDGSRFVALADEAITQIVAQGKLPVVVGGTGMYLDFLVWGLSESPPKDDALRAELLRRGKEEGAEVLYQGASGGRPKLCRNHWEKRCTPPGACPGGV